MLCIISPYAAVYAHGAHRVGRHGARGKHLRHSCDLWAWWCCLRCYCWLGCQWRDGRRPLAPLQQRLLRRGKIRISCPEPADTWPHYTCIYHPPGPLASCGRCVRLDAPVTSATCAFAKPTTVTFDNSFCGCGASAHDLPEGTLHQYVLSIANRDPAQFESPDTLHPPRASQRELGRSRAISCDLGQRRFLFVVD